MRDRIGRACKMMIRPEIPAALCAALLLCVIPLVFHDGFFDINRIKVNIVCFAVPLLSGWGLFSFLGNRCLSGQGTLHKDVGLPLAACAALMAASICSSAGQGFSAETLYGSTGRYCGLLFLLCCGLAFCVMVLAGLPGRIIAPLISVVACLVAFLGILNGAGLDPFGFYARISKAQISMFLSTIGNIDFFGAYLAMLYPLAAAFSVQAKQRGQMLLYGAAAYLIVCGVAVSRSDSAWIAVQLSALALTALCDDSDNALGRAFMLWGISWTALPVMRPVLQMGLWEIGYSGLFEVLCDTGAVWHMFAVFLLLSFFCVWHGRKGSPLLKRRHRMRLAALLFVLAITIIALMIVYFTYVNPEAELGAAQNLLRFSDTWGTRRGFVYRCAVRAFSDFSWREKLFGGGVDSAARLLKPYFDNDSMLRYGTFNDAHCQPLQFLLTTGILGASAYAALYGLLLRSCIRFSRGDALLCGASASLSGYFIIAMLGVTQPIVVVTYFALSAIAVSRIHHLTKRREFYES